MPRRRTLAFESLENRKLMAVVVQDGIIGIRGTKLDDTIAIQRSGNQYQVDFNGERTFLTAPSTVRAIVIDGWNGNDSIRVDDNITNLTLVVGGKGDDYIKGGSGENYLSGDAGNDSITGGGGNSDNEIDGGAGDDYIRLGDGGGSAIGGKGNDVMLAGRNGGTLLGGAGNDELHADPTVSFHFGTLLPTGNTILDGEAGNDLITGGTGRDDIKGGAGNDTLYGGMNIDRLDGGAGNDAIYGEEDNDWCSGGAGNDIIWGGNDGDQLFGDAGIDQVYCELGNDEIHGGAGNDILVGSDHNDTLFGDAGNDQMFGDDGSDNLEGGKGNDECHGGLGDDQLNGGVGADLLDGDSGNNLIDSDNGTEVPLNGVAANLDSEVYAFLSSPSALGGWAEARFEVTNDNGGVTSTFSLRASLISQDGHHTPFANTQFTLIIDGEFVGKVTTDSQGMVDVVFSSNPTGNQLPLPLAFPTLQAGMTIQIGNLISGTFEHKIYI